MSFTLRPPSAAWEPLALSADPPRAVWAWFKPVPAPNSVIVQIPPEFWQTAVPVTVRQLAVAAGIESLVGWSLYGQSVPLDERTAAFVDVPLQPPTAGVDPQIILWTPVVVAAPVMMPPATPSHAGGASDLLPGEDPGPMFDMMHSYWMTLLGIESEVRRTRMQLEQSMSRVSSLNRDLNPEEAIAADNLDKKDWQDARRWLRDAMAGLSRSIKEIDVGTLSGAGSRHKFEDLYTQFVKPRVLFPGMKQAVIDFEMHVKSAKNVMQSAQTALTKGSADAERKANTVLQRIAVKSRNRRNKARGMNA